MLIISTICSKTFVYVCCFSLIMHQTNENQFLNLSPWTLAQPVMLFSTLFLVFGYPDETLSLGFDILLQKCCKANLQPLACQPFTNNSDFFSFNLLIPEATTCIPLKRPDTSSSNSLPHAGVVQITTPGKAVSNSLWLAQRGMLKLQNDQHISMQPIVQFMLDTSVAIFFFLNQRLQ